jgi:hypothetical protein
MNKILLSSFLVFAASNLAYSQFPLPGFEKLKQINLLDANHFQVKQILWDFKAGELDDEDHTQRFSTDDMSVEVKYSSGTCLEDEDDDDGKIWDVPEWKATAIEIEPEEPIKFGDIKIDLSKFREERMYIDLPRIFIYHAKNAGIAFEVDDNGIRKIYLFPASNARAKLCGTKAAEKYISKSWFGNSKLVHRRGEIACYHADVTGLILSSSEFAFTDSNKEVSTETAVSNPNDDVLIYNYSVYGR